MEPVSAVRRLLSRDQAVLLVVDMQEKLLPAIAGADRILRSCRRIVRAAQTLGLPVLFTEQYPRGLGRTVPGLAALFGESPAIEKTAFGCFDCAEFVDAIERTARHALLLCGIEAHICVYQTALQALGRGLDVYLLEDAVGARSDEARQVGLARLHAAGAVPSHTEMAIYELLGAAATPEFRAILPIIKEESDLTPV